MIIEKADKFTSPSQGPVDVEEMIQHIAEFIDESAQYTHRIVIGTDSQTKRINGEAEIDFVTAVVIHKVGYGARYFWRRERQKRMKP